MTDKPVSWTEFRRLYCKTHKCSQREAMTQAAGPYASYKQAHAEAVESEKRGRIQHDQQPVQRPQVAQKPKHQVRREPEKKPAKRVRYEEARSDSEEEIVYVKKRKAQKAPKKKKIVYVSESESSDDSNDF